MKIDETNSIAGRAAVNTADLDYWTIPTQVDDILICGTDSWEEGFLSGLLERFHDQK